MQAIAADRISDGGARGQPAGSSAPDVLFITRKWPPAVGGMETYSARLSEALARLCRVKVIALPGRGDGSPPSGWTLIRFGACTAWALLTARRAAPVVHVADMASWPLALAARLRSRRTAIVLSAHGTDVSYPLRGGMKGRLYGAYLRLGARCLGDAVVLANSRATAACAGRYGFRRIEVCPLATAMRAPDDPAPPGDFILFAGRLVAGKGCAWFVRSVLPQLPEQLRLTIAGTLWSPEEAKAIGAPRVEYLGPQPHDALAGLYARALCVVFPRIAHPSGVFEGFGLAATEASACGGVSLASDHSGLREAVIDGVTGFLLPAGDAEAWARKIREILRWPPETRAAFVARAMEATAAHYSWERVARETHAAYGRARAGAG